MSVADALVAAASTLRQRTRPMTEPFGDAAYVLNPLDYAWAPHEAYLRRFGGLGARALWVGMNPGPWGMAQTGVPFGAVPRVRGFLGIEAPVHPPPRTHPKRPVEGFCCGRTEVSGDRLWGTVEQVCGTPERFFAAHLVLNYCPLLWQGATGRNLTPDKLPAERVDPLFEACDAHLVAAVRATGAQVVIGVGAWAERRARRALAEAGLSLPVGRLLHPSPASPAANRGWAQAAIEQLAALGHPLPPAPAPAD